MANEIIPLESKIFRHEKDKYNCFNGNAFDKWFVLWSKLKNNDL